MEGEPGIGPAERIGARYTRPAFHIARGGSQPPGISRVFEIEVVLAVPKHACSKADKAHNSSSVRGQPKMILLAHQWSGREQSDNKQVQP